MGACTCFSGLCTHRSGSAGGHVTTVVKPATWSLSVAVPISTLSSNDLWFFVWLVFVGGVFHLFVFRCGVEQASFYCAEE